MTENILIVDDVGKNIQVLARILSSDKYAISYATNGQKALEMVRTQNYDLILLDIMMPDMDGFEVCRKIKQMPDKKDIPIIYLTALTQKEDIVKGLETGAVDYIIKPFNSTELKARVNTHLELKKARDHITIQNIVLQERNEDLKTVNKELSAALDKIKTLEGIIPICCVCKKIRDDKGYWEQIELYISKHSKAAFSHGICPDCMKIQYPDFAGD
ncbi:MAG: response regulator [Pseudomonadota bacterium]